MNTVILNQKKIFFRKIFKNNYFFTYRRYTSENIRRSFIEYFEKNHDHKHIRSSPVIPYCDKTVPFVNAGMNQFKDIFLGHSDPPCKRAVNSQKCVRIGGKHNDLDIVGTDSYHHTFFEMLGNWSFGDYFKKDACKMAWDLLTREYKINPNRLYVTYFEGDKSMNIPADVECREIWRSIGVDENRILPFAATENFWEMGSTGPCGPCTEIHIDHLDNSDANMRAKFVNANKADLTELWNIVFIQYLRNENNELKQLPRQYIDTGMGLERLTAILQKKSSNYDTDLFTPIFESIAKETKLKKYQGTFDPKNENYQLDTFYRTLADHARMCTICIGDGLYPEQNHRLRRVFRKTIDICNKIFKKPNLFREVIASKIVENLGSAYPELETDFKRIQNVIEYETDSYQKLLNKSLKSIEKFRQYNFKTIDETEVVKYPGLLNAIKDIERKWKENQNLNVEKLYYLHHTFGLNEDILGKLITEMKLIGPIDSLTDFIEMKRKSAKSELALKEEDYVNELVSQELQTTDDSYKYFYFYNHDTNKYDLPQLEAKVLWMKKDKVNKVEYIVLEKTNFYGTAGGQDCDTGIIENENGQFIVEQVNFINNYVVHIGRFSDNDNEFKIGDQVMLLINSERRTALSQHHTGIHLLQATIKAVTKKIIYQKSSHASEDCLKFEFGILSEKLTDDEISKIESIIERLIKDPREIRSEILSAHELYSCPNVTVLPGAVYPDKNIRVKCLEHSGMNLVSIEPCCGTHVNSTSELLSFCITRFKSTKIGTFEIIAHCGKVAEKFKNKTRILWNEIIKLETRVKNETLKYEDQLKMLAKTKQLKNDFANNEIPYVSKQKSILKLEEIEKIIIIALRQYERNWMKQQIDEAMKQNKSNRFVHILYSLRPMELKVLNDALLQYTDTPIAVVNVCKDKFAIARIVIPPHLINDKFDAQIWVNEIFGDIKDSLNISVRGRESAIVRYTKGKEVELKQLESLVKI